MTGSQTTAEVVSELKGRVLWLRLNRPETRNALSLAMIKALKSAFSEAFENPQVRVIVLASTGPVFSAGHHLGEMAAGDTRKEHEANQRRILDACADLMLSLTRGPKPVIAAVRGFATAAGCQLAATCDLLIAGDEATFCTPGVNVGGFCTTPLVGIGRKLRRNHAMEFALTGERFPAEEAFRMGLVNRVVPATDLEAEVQALAEKIASKSAQAIATGKPAFYTQVDLPLEEAYRFATEEMIKTGTTDDAKEGNKAFFEKRKPKWTGI